MDVFVAVPDIWNYFNLNREILREEQHLVAEDPEYDIQIYLTEEGWLPHLSLEVCGEVIEQKSTAFIEDLYRTYLCAAENPKSEPDMDESYKDESDLSDAEETEIDLRDEEIYNSVEDMLYTMLENSAEESGLSESDVWEISDKIERLLWEDYRLSVRHPAVIDGTLVEFPFGGGYLDE